MLRAAVERDFEIIGEALSQLAKHHPPLAVRISEARRIIAFRNIPIHRHADVDDQLVWDVVETKLPACAGRSRRCRRRSSLSRAMLGPSLGGVGSLRI
jgi:uncharacterized protein with HEPN domain